MSKQRYNLKQYTELIVNKDHDGRYAKVTWINAGDLLDLLTRLEEAEKAEKQLAAIPCEDQAQEVRDFIDWGPKQEVDYGDLYDAFVPKAVA